MSHPESNVANVQAEYRRQLAKIWAIPSGSRVLEVGCGQGDMTAVLAEAVRPDGRVLAVDLADPTYGAPLTLGEATDKLKASELGSRIEFRFQCDLLDPSVSFDYQEFDYAVMAHCSWYFESSAQLRRMLTRLAGWSKRLCFAEWDMAMERAEQMPHFLAVLILGQVEAHRSDSLSNIRTPFPHTVLSTLLAEAGWEVTRRASPDTSALQDADWEIRHCIENVMDGAVAAGLPPRLLDLLGSQVKLLESCRRPERNAPLPAYALVADSHCGGSRDSRL